MAKFFKHPFCNKTLQAPPGATNVTAMDVFCGGGRCISAWKLSWCERFSALIHGTVWLDLISGASQPPAKITAVKNYFTKPPKR